MSDQVVVTLRFDKTERDYALPAGVMLGELYPRLLTVLQNSDPDAFRTVDRICFCRKDGYLLDPRATLLDYDVHNGARLTVSMEG